MGNVRVFVVHKQIRFFVQFAVVVVSVVKFALVQVMVSIIAWCHFFHLLHLLQLFERFFGQFFGRSFILGFFRLFLCYGRVGLQVFGATVCGGGCGGADGQVGGRRGFDEGGEDVGELLVVLLHAGGEDVGAGGARVGGGVGARAGDAVGARTAAAAGRAHAVVGAAID